MLQLYDKLAGLVDKGWSGVTEWLQQVGKELSEKLFSAGEITREILDAVKTGLLKTAIDLVAGWASKLNPAGGLVAAIQAIYKVVKWVVDNKDKLQKLAESVIQGVQALVNGSGVEKVAEYVEKGLAGAFMAVADFILSFFHLDAIPKTIRQVSDKWVDIVPRKLAELLGRLKGVLLEQLQRLWGGYWGRAEWTAGNEKHKIWVDFRSGKVLMASRAQEPSVYVKDLRRRAVKNERAAAAAGKAADALAVAEKAAGEMQSATARAANKGASESERATAVKAAAAAKAKTQKSLEEFAKDAGEAESAVESCSKGGGDANAKCDRCKEAWGVPEGGKYYKLTTKVVEYTVERPKCNFSTYEKGYEKQIRKEDVVGKTFKHPVVVEMVFRFEGKTGAIEGLGKGTMAARLASAWAKCAAGKGRDDAGGHVIHEDWGGRGDLPRDENFGIFKGAAPFLNLVPLNKTVNSTGDYHLQESNVTGWAKKYPILCVRISFQYSDDKLPARPTQFKWEFMWKDASGTWGGEKSNTRWLDN